MPVRSFSLAQWCASAAPDCAGLLRNAAVPCPRLDDCPDAETGDEADLNGRRLQPGQPILLIYREPEGLREVFGEVRLPLGGNDLVRLYFDDGGTYAVLLRLEARRWIDLTNQVRVRLVEELSGAQLSRFMLYRDYASSGCAPRRQPSLKGLRASA